MDTVNQENTVETTQQEERTFTQFNRLICIKTAAGEYPCG